jgi:hypothetical protein
MGLQLMLDHMGNLSDVGSDADSSQAGSHDPEGEQSAQGD